MSAELKDRLKKIEADKNAARDELAAKSKERQAAVEAFKGNPDLDHASPEFKAAQDVMRAEGEVKERIENLRELEVGVLKMLGQDPAVAARSGNGDQEPAEEWASKSLFTESVRGRLEKAATSQAHFGDLNLGAVASRDAIKADVTGTASIRRGTYAGIVPQLRRRIRLLDLISIGTTDGTTVPYTQTSGTYGAAEVTEGATKPESGLTYTDQTALVQTIAAWQKVPKQVLADFAALQSIIDDRLRYEVLRRLEGQILAGTGSAPQLQGILGASGIGTFTGITATPFGEQILSGLTQVMLAEAEPTAIVLSPTDWQKVLTFKATGSGEYLNEIEPVQSPGTGNVGGMGSTIPTLWGVPVVASTVISAGTALVGDFTIGCQLFIRQGVEVLMSDSDGTDFIQNRVTLLAEMRAALAVWQPSAFSKVTLTT